MSQEKELCIYTHKKKKGSLESLVIMTTQFPRLILDVSSLWESLSDTFSFWHLTEHLFTIILISLLWVDNGNEVSIFAPSI